MIKFEGKTYRNIQEQVEANKQAIEALKTTGQTLAAFGIKVVGNVPTEEDLPNPAAYIGNYGDAYLLGATQPYDIAIFTRPFGDQVNPAWVNIGRFPAVGPQGPQGIQGLAGADGASINVTHGEDAPIILGGETESDIYIRTDSDYRALYVFHDGHWNYVVSLEGPQGPQGPQGQKGPAGDTINVVSKLASTSLLPTNFSSGTIPKNSAYLILDSTSQTYHVWVIAGQADDYSTWSWVDGGSFTSETGLEFQDTEEIVFDREGNTVTAMLQNDVTNNISRALKTPVSAPVENKLVGVTPQNEQAMFGVGEGLVLEDGVLKAAGGSSAGDLEILWTGSASYGGEITINNVDLSKYNLLAMWCNNGNYHKAERQVIYYSIAEVNKTTPTLIRRYVTFGESNSVLIIACYGPQFKYVDSTLTIYLNGDFNRRRFDLLNNINVENNTGFNVFQIAGFLNK